MRIMLKGGVWKNTEDEILKAAVMKYGLNQWARISSLLVHKSAKQCKARWYEWLDPWIKKTEWSAAEDEKLLHLAKVMPCQWRTIAPIVGRTSAQCLERYEHLLDLAQRKYVGEAIEARRLRPGEIDPTPESKPARPDPVDMDEDEKEMLSEARARLANTKGKKAKRKAREKQLQTARRLASLQKHREMHAAGLTAQLFGRRRKKRRKFIDYSVEIPFQRRAPRGFYDTTEEDAEVRRQTAHARAQFKPVFVSELEGDRRDAIEERERKKDAQRQRQQKKLNLPAVLQRLNELSGAKDEDIPKAAMVLPKPQLADSDLQQLAKMEGFEALMTSAAATPMTVASSILSTAGIGIGSVIAKTPATAMLATAGSLRTPQLKTDRILAEARNAALRTAEQTPLLGGDSARLLQTASMTAATAAVTATQHSTAVATPSALSTARLKLLESAATGKRSRRKVRSEKRAILEGFERLPSPQHEYDVALPSLPEEEEEEKGKEGRRKGRRRRGGRKLDASEKLKRKAATQKRMEELEWSKQTTVIQSRHESKKHCASYKLPTATRIDSGMLLACESAPQKLIRKEMLALVTADATFDADFESGGVCTHKADERLSAVKLKAADDLITAEMEDLKLTHPLGAESDEMIVDDSDTFSALLSSANSDCCFLPSSRRFEFISTKPSAVGQKIAARRQEFALLRQQLASAIAVDGKTQRKVDILTQGYQKVAGNLLRETNRIRQEMCDKRTQIEVFERMRDREQLAIGFRLKEMKQLVDAQKKLQVDSQQEYAKLQME